MIQKWNVALLRVRRLAHSLKRDTRSAVVHHPAGSPMSMTSPRTTLTCGHNAPLTLRPSAAPRLYFAITGATACFFGAICGTQGRFLRSHEDRQEAASRGLLCLPLPSWGARNGGLIVNSNGLNNRPRICLGYKTPQSGILRVGQPNRCTSELKPPFTIFYQLRGGPWIL